MGAPLHDLPKGAPIARGDLDSAFARRVLGRREARRLAELMADAERRARARLDQARLEAEEIFAHARAEAEAMIAALPDFAVLEATPAKKGKTALKLIREAADRHGLPMALVTGKTCPVRVQPAVRQARQEAVHAVREQCPHLTSAEIGTLFGGRTAKTIETILRGARDE